MSLSHMDLTALHLVFAFCFFVFIWSLLLTNSCTMGSMFLSSGDIEMQSQSMLFAAGIRPVKSRVQMKDMAENMWRLVTELSQTNKKVGNYPLFSIAVSILRLDKQKYTMEYLVPDQAVNYFQRSM